MAVSVVMIMLVVMIMMVMVMLMTGLTLFRSVIDHGSVPHPQTVHIRSPPNP